MSVLSVSNRLSHRASDHRRRVVWGPQASALCAKLLVGAIRWYQVALSPLLGPACRYYPTCSHYAVEAIQRYGAGRGSWLALRRLLRCHPFRPGGYDPVP